jgi:hypothetical protein
VEYGGFLRIVTLDHNNGFTTYEIKNNVSKFLPSSSSSSSSSQKAVETKGQDEWLKQEPDALNQIFVIQLKSNTYVSEKTMIVSKTGNSSLSSSGEAPTEEAGTRKGREQEEEEEDTWNPITISSFNFTEAAFNNKVWNAQTIKARGLFIDAKTNKVLGRSYDKFFNVDEVPSVQQQGM